MPSDDDKPSRQRDNPIDPPGADERFVAEVIDLAEVRVQWGRPRNRTDRCAHRKLTYNQEQHRVWCHDCEQTIENFQAFMVLVRNFQDMVGDVRRKNEAAQKAANSTLVRRAAKEIDRVWSGNTMGVCCPHCNLGLFPEDFAAHGVSSVSREYETARRARKAKEQPHAD